MDAIDRLEQLIHAVGDGDIEARCVVDQPYAQDQHENMEYRHPRGGRARFLGGPLVEQADHLMGVVAESLVTPEGTDIVGGMTRVAETMSGFVEDNAPRLNEVLRYSGHPQVVDNGQVVYDRAPKIHRGA